MQRSQTESHNSLQIKLVKVVHRPTAPSEYTLSKNFSIENYRNFEFNGKLYSSVWPEKIDLLSPTEQEELKDASWFQAGLPREISLEILLQQPPGSFLVRQSESHRKCLALSIRSVPLDPPKLSHYLIEKTGRGYRFRGFVKEFSCLKSLVIHHSVLKEHLPVPLVLPRQQQEIDVESCIDGDYTTKDENDDMDEEDSLKSPTTTLCFRKKSKEK